MKTQETNVSLAELQVSALAEAPCGIAIADLSQDEMPIVYANRAFYALAGVEPTVASSLAGFLTASDCLADSTATICDQLRANPRMQTICRAPQDDPQPLWLSLSFSPLDGSGSQTSYVVVTVQDETEHRSQIECVRAERLEVEERLVERSKALERINQDLEGFTFSVSHDLRAPLRAIMGFSKALVEDYGRAVDSEMKQTLDRINAAAVRMATIIEDLLTFSRLGRKEFVRRKIDLSDMAHSVAADFKRRHPARDITFEIEDHLKIDGDPTLVRMAIENLLDNAAKFTSKVPRGIVSFRRAGPRTFVVQDNGAGFDPQFADKLFRPFERLHSASEFPGTGIGLANVQRIVERHGGKVWAEGKPNEGASFYFCL
jgi:signal transduction histidine kinase